MIRASFAYLPLLCLLACSDNDPSFPPTVITSATVVDEQVHMSVYANSTVDETELSVYAHAHHPDGFAQYLDLSGDDELRGGGGDWIADFSVHRLPTSADPTILYYRALYPESVAGTPLGIDFLRNQAPLLSANIRLLELTTYSVTADVEPLTPQSTVSVAWQAIDTYEYRLQFAFSCENLGDDIGFRVSYPRYSEPVLASPFDLDIGQFSPPPANASDCQLEISLIAEQDQSGQQAVVDDNLNVVVSRRQVEVLPIVLDAAN